MNYRQQLEFDNAELSAIHIVGNRVVVRVRTASDEPGKAAVEPNHLPPIRLARANGDHLAAVGDRVKPVEPVVWQALDAVNRTGQCEAADKSEASLRKLRRLANKVLAGLGVAVQLVIHGRTLRPENVSA